MKNALEKRKPTYKLIDGIPIWQHFKNGSGEDEEIKLIGDDFGRFAEILGKRVVRKLMRKGGILEELFPGIEICAVKNSDRIKMVNGAKIELGDTTFEIGHKNGIGFGKKILIFEIKHGKFQIEQNQLRRYCSIIEKPEEYFPKANEVKIVYLMFNYINTFGGSASYSIYELDKDFAHRILYNEQEPNELELLSEEYP